MGTDVVPEVKESPEQISQLDKQIIRQVEYYFGNYNLNRDKFLKEQITLDDGWVPLETLIKFHRLKSLSEDFKVICEALQKSSSGLLEVDAESNKIRRSVDKPLPGGLATNEEIRDRTVYVKGFKKTATLDELLDFFKDHKAESVSMRHFKPQNKDFKGSCFVTFETLEDAQTFLGLKGIKYQGTELLRETKKDYMKRKDEVYENRKKEIDRKKAERALKNEPLKKDGEELKMVPGCLLKLSGLSSDLTREDLKTPLEKYGTVVYVDYSKGKPEGVIRFETGVAKDALEGLSVEEDGVKKIEYKGVKAVATLVEGEEEEEYWKNIAISKASHRARFAGFNKQKGRFGKQQNWNRRGKRQNRNDENNHPSKRTKTEEKGDAEENDHPPSKRTKTEEKGDAQEKTTEVKQEPVKTEPKMEVAAN